MESEAFPDVQKLIDDYVNTQVPAGAKVGVVMGVVAPEQPAGELLFGGSLLNRSTPPCGMSLNGSTPFEIGSVSKVFTTGIFAMLNQESAFAQTLSSALGAPLTTSSYVGGITLAQLASYCSGLPQDNGYCPTCPNTGYPTEMMESLESLFNALASFSPTNDPGLAPGAYYTYSNVGMALLSMAALSWQNLDTDQFSNALNQQLISYCKQFAVDTGNTPTTTVYSSEIAGNLPLGYDQAYNSTTLPPCYVPGYGSGGIVSTGNDMLQFLRYQMSTDCAMYLQDAQSGLEAYCNKNTFTWTGYGWFRRPVVINHQSNFLVCKDGGVSGFTAWIGFEARASQSDASPCGVVVLTNGPAATSLGVKAFELIAGASLLEMTRLSEDRLDPPADAEVH